MNHTVSIILPAYNCVHFIARAIESVLAQSCKDWELIILDDGSTDGTDAVALSYAKRDARIKFIQNSNNKGVQYTLKRGLEVAGGEYIARIDADDSWCAPEKLAVQLDFLKKHSDHVLVGTGAIIVSEVGNELYRFLPQASDAEIRARLLIKNCFMHSSVLFKKAAALAVGGYDQTGDTRHIEDYDLWLKLGTVGKLANIPFYGLLFKTWPMAVSAQNRSVQFKKTIALIKKYRKNYPHYYRGLLFAHARYYFYRLYQLLPAQLRHALLRRYKQL